MYSYSRPLLSQVNKQVQLKSNNRYHVTANVTYKKSRQKLLLTFNSEHGFRLRFAQVVDGAAHILSAILCKSAGDVQSRDRVTASDENAF